MLQMTMTAMPGHKLDSRGADLTVVLHCLCAKCQPVEGGEVDGLGAVPAVAEAAVEGAREGDHELPRLLHRVDHVHACTQKLPPLRLQTGSFPDCYSAFLLVRTSCLLGQPCQPSGVHATVRRAVSNRVDVGLLRWTNS